MDDLFNGPLPEDAGTAYGAYRDNVDDAGNEAWLNDLIAPKPAPGGQGQPQAGAGEDPAAAVADLTGGAPAASDEPAKPAAQAPGQKPADEGRGVMETVGAAAADILTGATESLPQSAGGVIDAVNSMLTLGDDIGQFMEQTLGIPNASLQIFDKEGNLDIGLLTSTAERLAAGLDIAQLPTVAEADSTTGGMIRTTAQFLTGFLPAVGAIKGVQGASALGQAINTPFARETLAGAMADLVVWDPHEERLSTYLNTIPGLAAVVPDYLADNNPDNEGRWEGRLKNAIEGAGLGLMTEGLVRAFRYYKSARAGKVAAGQADNLAETAARDAIKDAAQADLIVPVDEKALAGLGDETAGALIDARPDETATEAFGRIHEAKARAERAGALDQTLADIDAMLAKMPGGTDEPALNQLLDQVRSNRQPPKMPNFPVLGTIKDLGGVDPTSPLAAELRNLGVTNRSMPGLFRNGGRKALDNIPRNELGGFFGDAIDPTDYINEGEWLDGVRRELAGDPMRSAEQQAVLDQFAPTAEMRATLENAGIDVDNMSNDSVRQALDDLRQERAQIAEMDAAPPIEQTVTAGADMTPEELAALPGRSEADLLAEDAAGALPQINGEPPVPDGTYRVYHSGSVGEGQTGRWVSTSRQYAKDYRKDLPLFYLDLPEGDPRLADATYPEQSVKHGFTFNFELTPEEAARLQRVDAAGALPGVSRETAERTQPKVYINLARVKSSDDVKQLIQVMADQDADAIKAKTRGKVSNAQTVREAAQEYRKVEDLIGRAPGPMSASEAVAARKLLVASGEQLLQLAKKARGADATAADLYAFRRAVSVHYALQSEVIAARTETARALQSWSIPTGSSKARADAIDDLIRMEGGAGNIQRMAQALETLADNPAGLNAAVKQSMRGRLGKAFYEAWINGLLSSPKTHMVNVMSNTLTAVWAIPERLLASGISKVFYNGEISGSEVGAMAYGLTKGIRDGFRLIAKGQRAAGLDDVGDLFQAFSKLDAGPERAISATAFGADPAGVWGHAIDYMGRFANLPGTALQAEDNFFKSIGYRMELHAQAYRVGVSEGLEGRELASRMADIIANPPEALKADALDFAHYQTFTKKLGPQGQSLQTLLARVPGARLVMPFVRTPTNILKYAFERTPLAIASAKVRADIAAGGARAAQAWAKITTGTMAMLTVADMSTEGVITGNGPADKDQRRALLRTGWQPYSVKFGDRYYAYNRADPIGMLLGFGADISEIVGSAGEEDGGRLVTAGAVAFAGNMANKTYMSGLYDFIAALDPGNPTSDPGKWLQDFSGSLMPYSSALRNVAGAIDPVAREVRTSDQDELAQKYFGGMPAPVAEYLAQIMNEARSNVPGLSENLPPRRDLWGEPIDRASGIGWGWDLLSPIASRVGKGDPVDQVIFDNRVKVSPPQRVIEGVRLTGDEYSQFVELAGRPAKEYLDKFVASPGFKRLSDGPEGAKAEVLRRIVLQFRDQARAQMLYLNPALRERVIAAQTEKARLLQGGQ